LVVYGPERKLGAVVEDQVVDLNPAYAKYLRETQDEPHPYLMAAAVVPAELGAFIESGPRAIEGAEAATEYLNTRAGDRVGLRGEALLQPLASVKLHAPYANRCRIMMAGANYAIHSQGMTRGDQAAMTLEQIREQSRARGLWGFYCFPENAIGPDEEIVYPARTDRLDYEGEVAVILGRRGKDISEDKAEPYYWGYMLQNDVSARTNIPGGPDNPQSSFARGKNFDTSIAGGPYIVVGEFPDAQDISWETRVNGEVRQTGNTRDMTFSFGYLLSYLSADMTLMPGDVISAGTTAGTAQDSSPLMEDGQKRDPARFLKPGDTVEVSNPLMGTLRNRVVLKK
jgi:acylpyruvate hydrolase